MSERSSKRGFAARPGDPELMGPRAGTVSGTNGA